MAFSDYEHCHYCVADKEAGRPLPERHGYKGLYTGDTEVPDHINVICSHHLRVLKDEIYDLRNKVTELSAPKPQILPNDLDHLDPGIKDLVLTLRDKGVKTTDSGDGVSKLPCLTTSRYSHRRMRCSLPSTSTATVSWLTA